MMVVRAKSCFLVANRGASFTIRDKTKFAAISATSTWTGGTGKKKAARRRPFALTLSSEDYCVCTV
jgi:hypothetical protein